MGTRGLLGLIIQGKRHAAYNHWDSYPSNLGAKVVEFILSLKLEDIAEMAALVQVITWVDEKSTPSPELQKQYSEAGYANLAMNTKSLDNWYCLLNNVQGARALPAIQSGKLKHLEESVDFLKDGLMCEWAYFIDFEEKKFETWKGPIRRGTEVMQVAVADFGELSHEYMDYIEEEFNKHEE